MTPIPPPEYHIRPKYSGSLKSGGDHSGNGFEVYSRGRTGHRLVIRTYSFDSARQIRDKLLAGAPIGLEDYF
jgi:hypothetical protein